MTSEDLICKIENILLSSSEPSSGPQADIYLGFTAMCLAMIANTIALLAPRLEEFDRQGGGSFQSSGSAEFIRLALGLDYILVCAAAGVIIWSYFAKKLEKKRKQAALNCAFEIYQCWDKRQNPSSPCIICQVVTIMIRFDQKITTQKIDRMNFLFASCQPTLRLRETESV